MSNDPAPGGEQPGWQGQQPYPGSYGQHGQHGQRHEQPAYPAAAYAPTQGAGYGQASPPWAAQGQGNGWGAGGYPHGSPAGLGPGGAPTPGHAQNFTTALFDFGFNEFATPVVIKVLYILSIVGIGLAYVIGLVYNFFLLGSPIAGLLFLVVGGIVALVALIYTRVILELLYAGVRMAEDIRVLRNRP